MNITSDKLETDCGTSRSDRTGEPPRSGKASLLQAARKKRARELSSLYSEVYYTLLLAAESIHRLCCINNVCCKTPYVFCLCAGQKQVHLKRRALSESLVLPDSEEDADSTCIEACMDFDSSAATEAACTHRGTMWHVSRWDDACLSKPSCIQPQVHYLYGMYIRHLGCNCIHDGAAHLRLQSQQRIRMLRCF